MVGQRPLPLSLWMLGAAILVGLAAVHVIAYTVGYGIDGYEAAMVASGHEPWWTLAAVGALALLAFAAAAVRGRVRFSRARVVQGPRARAALVIRTWALLLVGSVVGYVLLENAEHLIRAGHLAGLTPIAQVVRLAAVGPLVAAVTALALLAVAVAVVGRVEYATVLTRSYATLVADGTFDDAFRQSPWATAFVAEVLGPLLRHAGPGASVLEAGCGTGVWLEELASLAAPMRGTRLHGFDLSADMAGAASVRLGRAGVIASVWQGDVLDDAAYGEKPGALHELVFAYDVVQQLPSEVQADAVSTMLRHVAPGGHLVVFDHDRRSRYGRVMGAKKWLRRYLGVPLVPRFYIHARYPELGRIRRVMEREGHTATVVVEREARKRALVVRRA